MTPLRQTSPQQTPQCKHPPLQTPPPRQTPPFWADTPSWVDTPPGQTPPSWADRPRADTPQTDTLLGRHPRMVNAPVVRILLECILVLLCSCFLFKIQYNLQSNESFFNSPRLTLTNILKFSKNDFCFT